MVASSRSRSALHDVSDRLLIPEKLYGREREIDALLAAFDRVVADGTPELVLVSGYSGIGKSSVVNELHKALVPPRGLFASGKFDQYKRDIPYATLGQAFQSLVRSLLAKSEAEVGRWRDALQRGAGPEWPAHRQPRSRAGARHRETAAGPGPAAAGRAEPLPDGVPALPRRVRAAGAPARAVPRRFAMAGCGNARPAGASGHPSGCAAPAAGRRLPGQRGQSLSPAHADAGGDPQGGSEGAGDSSCAARARRLGQLVADTLHCTPDDAAPAGAAGAREDRRQSVLRHPVPYCARRRRAARVRS